MKTAKILIVGNEILSGRTADTNSHFLAKALFTRGVRLQKIEVIADDTEAISDWIRHQAPTVDFALVCGGIGGTPDDVTRAAVAQGVGVKLVRNPEAEKILNDFYGSRINESRMSMADLPEGCSLIENKVTQAPGFKIKNIYVFAGIPKILYAMFESVQSEFQGTPLIEREMDIKVGEGDIAEYMVTVNDEFPELELGSYPTLDSSKPYKTQLVFRSQDKTVVEKAFKRFEELMRQK